MLAVLTAVALSVGLAQPEDPAAPSAEPAVDTTAEEPAPEDPVEPEPEDPVEPEPEEDGSIEDALERAKALYFAGEHNDALELLLGIQVRLLMGDDSEWDAGAEALVYLGEIQFKVGQVDEARQTFHWLLERDPDYPISPYHHPLEVVGLFGQERDAVLQNRPPVEPPPLPPPAPPLPGRYYTPLGIPQFADGKTGTGLVFATLQVGFGVGSLAAYAHLVLVNDPGGTGHPLGWSDPDVAPRVNLRRFGLQWPLTAGFYGTWLASHLEARRRWKRTHDPQPRVTVLPQVGPGAAAVRVHAAF